jgi:hypothetical protein
MRSSFEEKMLFIWLGTLAVFVVVSVVALVVRFW